MAEGTTSRDNAVVPPLNLLLILKEGSGVDLFSLPVKDLRNKLLAGIILRDKKENTETQLFWMDEKSDLNCFMLLPKALTISAESRQVPCYVSEQEKRGTGPEITLTRVKYERVGRLVVGGKFCTMGLSGSEYEVVLFLKLISTRRSPRRIYSATSTKLSLPDGRQTYKPWEQAEIISTEEWYPFKVGTFRMNPNNVGELSFNIQVVFFWERVDVLIKGVAIQPPSVK